MSCASTAFVAVHSFRPSYTHQCTRTTSRSYVCEAFSANCTTVAVSGKGVYANCCDNGQLMPGYFLQTFGATTNTPDWDFSRWVPDALIINLGASRATAYAIRSTWTARAVFDRKRALWHAACRGTPVNCD